MDIYYQSEKFRQLLHRYEALQEDNISEFLDSEELTDVAEYYHYIGEDKKALEATDYAIRMYQQLRLHLLSKLVWHCSAATTRNSPMRLQRQ